MGKKKLLLQRKLKKRLLLLRKLKKKQLLQRKLKKKLLLQRKLLKKVQMKCDENQRKDISIDKKNMDISCQYLKNLQDLVTTSDSTNEQAINPFLSFTVSTSVISRIFY